MEQVEFQMQGGEMTPAPRSLAFNYDALHQYLTEGLKPYREMVVTEDGIADAKAARANVNRLKTALDDKRKEVKKEFMRPFEDFEKKCKTLTAMCDEASTAIGKQLTAFDDAKKAEKRSQIEKFFDLTVGEFKDVLTLNRIFDTRWLNSSYRMANIEQEIGSAINKLRDDTAAIKTLKSAYETELLAVLYDTLDLSQALNRKVKLEAIAEAAEAARKAKEKRDAEIEIVKADRMVDAEGIPADDTETVEICKFEDITQAVDVRLYLTQKQKAAFRMWCLENGVKYCAVPKH